MAQLAIKEEKKKSEGGKKVTEEKGKPPAGKKTCGEGVSIMDRERIKRIYKKCFSNA